MPCKQHKIILGYIAKHVNNNKNIMHTIRYRFHKSFPTGLMLPFTLALTKAIEMWEKSGRVRFVYSISPMLPVDFTITWEVIGKEYGDITKELYSPDISYRNKDEQDTSDTNLIINCDTKWKTKWYHIFRKEFDPILIAHNLGHIMGLCVRKHSKSPDSVMHEVPTKEPSDADFQTLGLALSKRNRRLP